MTTIYRSLSYPRLSDWFEYNGDDCLFWTTVDPLDQIFAVRPDTSEVVACANIASARAIAEGRAPALTEEPKVTTVSVSAFVSPSGQYYVMHGNQRMDVANKSTALYYVKNGVPMEIMLAASLSSLNQ